MYKIANILKLCKILNIMCQFRNEIIFYILHKSDSFKFLNNRLAGRWLLKSKRVARSTVTSYLLMICF
jgi:hypothetical protein